MSNTLGVYDPIFYAQEALIWLKKNLGMAGRVHRGYDKMPQEKGSVISIASPSTFTASAVNTSTGGTTQNITTGSVNITLDQWFEAKFALTEKELSYTQEKIIQDHIGPAAYALGDNIDQALFALYKKIPWMAAAVPSDVASFLAARKILFDNNVPLDGVNVHAAIGSTAEAALLALQAFTQYQGAGENAVRDMEAGSLGRKFGVEIFPSQNVPTHVHGTMSDVAGVASGTAGDTTITITALGANGNTMQIGDSFVIAGNTQRYVATTIGTVASPGTITGMGIYPALAATCSAAVVTISASATTSVQNLFFHKNAFALAMAPLTTLGNQLGARIASVVDPVSGLTVRSRLFYDGDKNTVKVALDVLYGVQVLNPNLACRAGVA